MNMNSVVSVQTVWEAIKDTCRGWCSSYNCKTQRKKSKKK